MLDIHKMMERKHGNSSIDELDSNQLEHLCREAEGSGGVQGVASVPQAGRQVTMGGRTVGFTKEK